MFSAARLLLLLLLSPISALAVTVQLATLEWPPYTSPHLPDGGLSTHIARQAFARLGMDLKVTFLPWQRAVRLAAEPDSPYVGYFPEYLPPTPTQWRISASLGISPLGFAMRADRPIEWQTLGDLAPYRIGTVSGYINTAQFDAMAAAGSLRVESATSDELNLLKLTRQRLDMVVIDREVFHFLMNESPRLSPWRGAIQFSPHTLEQKSLHIMFKPDREVLRRRFDEALQHLDIPRLTQEYRQRLGNIQQ